MSKKYLIIGNRCAGKTTAVKTILSKLDNPKDIVVFTNDNNCYSNIIDKTYILSTEILHTLNTLYSHKRAIIVIDDSISDTYIVKSPEFLQMLSNDNFTVIITVQYAIALSCAVRDLFDRVIYFAKNQQNSNNKRLYEYFFGKHYRNYNDFDFIVQCMPKYTAVNFLRDHESWVAKSDQFVVKTKIPTLELRTNAVDERNSLLLRMQSNNDKISALINENNSLLIRC